MSITQDIILTVHQLRRAPAIDIERLSYTLTEAEWIEFARELDRVTSLPRMAPIWHLDQVNFYGITVRKAKREDADPHRVPLRIEVAELKETDAGIAGTPSPLPPVSRS